MQVILIHGPPGAGKFTVATELSKITEYKVIHIHSIYDCLENIFTKDRYEISLKLLNKIYLDIFEEASNANVKGLIFTYTEIAKDDYAFVRKVKEVLDKKNGQLQFVHLVCNKDELKKRVLGESRKAFKKTKTIEELEYLLSIKDYVSIFPGSKTLELDNSILTPQDVAQKIKNHFSI